MPKVQHVTESAFQFILELIGHNVPVYFVDSVPCYICESGKEISLEGNAVGVDHLVIDIRNDGLYEIRTDQYMPHLRYYHYEKNGCSYLFFVNESPNMCVDTSIEYRNVNSTDCYRYDAFDNICYDENPKIIKLAGVRISPPYSIDISEFVVEGYNFLEVIIANTLGNAVGDKLTPYALVEKTGLLGPVSVNIF